MTDARGGPQVNFSCDGCMYLGGLERGFRPTCARVETPPRLLWVRSPGAHRSLMTPSWCPLIVVALDDAIKRARAARGH